MVRQTYLSANGTLNNATLLGSFTAAGSIGPRQQQAFNDQVTLPTVADGNYSLIVVDNAGNQIFERGATSNNTAVSAATIQIGHPDLVVDTVTAPQAAQSGTNIAVSWTGHNAGSVATGGGLG